MLKLAQKNGEKMKARRVFVTCMLVSVVLALLVGVSGATWCDAGSAKRTNVSVNNTAGSALTDYQVYVDLTANPINETSLRVYNATSCTLRPHWTENETGGNSYGVWINYSAVAASAWVNNTAIYYDNSSVDSVSNGTNTFEFFDDFPDTSIDTAKWEGETSYAAVSSSILTYGPGQHSMNSIINFSTGIALRSKREMTQPATNWIMFGLSPPTPTSINIFSNLFMAAGIIQRIGDADSYEDVTTNWTSGGYKTIELRREGSTAVRFFEGDIERTNSPYTDTVNITTIDIPIVFYPHTPNYVYADWVLIRNYNASEPTSSLGSEENRDKYTISGYVKTTTGTTIENVYISNNITSGTNYTNATGYYILSSLSNSTYNVSASKSWYITNQTTATVLGVNLTNKNITLLACDIPPTPINLQNTTGNTWINWTWQAGAGNITDSYNVSKNGVWNNSTTTTFYNKTGICAGHQVSIVVYSFNNTGSDCISENNVSSTQTLLELTWANMSYAHRVIVCVKNITTGFYQIKFNLHNGSGTNNATDIFMNNHAKTSDYSDIMIYNQTGVALSHYIENISVDPTVLWINATENGSVQMYYGRTSAISVSNGTATFNFFDEFEHTPIWERQGNCLSPTSSEPTVIYEGNPHVLTGETNVFKMWYGHGWSSPHVYYAESTDGLNWTQYSGNPVISDVYYRPSVFKNASTYYLYVSNSDTSIKRFHSSNGTHWTDDGTVLNLGAGGQWDDTNMANTMVWIENTTDWKMMYDAKGTGSGGKWYTGFATSTDGTTWAKSGSNPVITTYGGGAGHVEKIDSYYYLWTWGGASGCLLPTDMYRHRSTNLTTWEAYPTDPTFPRGTTDEGVGTAVGQVADETLLEHNGQVYMWYAASTDGGQESGNYHIKLAIANMTFAELIATNEMAEKGLDENKWVYFQYSGISLSDSIATLYKTDTPHTAILSKTYQISDGIIETRIRSPIAFYGTFIWFRRTTNTNGNYPRISGQGAHGQNCAGYQHSIIVDNINEANTVITADANWHYYRLIANGTVLTFKKFADGSFDTEQATVSYTDTGGLTSGYIGFEPWALVDKEEVDWIRVRKYASSEPSFTLGSEEDAPATTPAILNVQNGSISSTSQYIDWDVNQIAHNRVLYSNESDLTPAYYSTWDNSTAVPNITLSGLDASTQYWYQAWSYNTTNTSLNDNSSTLSFTTASESTYIPPDPTTLANTTGNFWVNHTWNVGGGNATDSYNVSWNLTWYNTTTDTFMQKEVGASNWGNITVYAFNSSGNGTLSTGSLSDNVQAPAYTPGDYPPATPTTLANTTGNSWVNYTWSSGGGANVTDSYNVSWNSTWYNTTLVSYMNDTVGEFGWANITIYAYNSSGNGSLSAGSVSSNTQADGGTFTTSMSTTVYNLITYYGSSGSTAEQFGLDIGSVDYIAKYNGSFYTHTMGFSANNFTTVHGIGYYVYLNASGSSTYSRNNISGTPYNTQLFNRWNTMGWTNATDTNAEGVAASIGSACKYTSSLNADGVTYTTHTVGFTSNNHAVEKGEGYWVWVNTGVSWDRNS